VCCETKSFLRIFLNEKARSPRMALGGDREDLGTTAE